MIEGDLVAWLKARMGVDVYHESAPQAASLPHIVLSLVGSDEDFPRGGLGGLVYGDWDVDCYAATPPKAAVLGDRLRSVLRSPPSVLGEHRVTLLRAGRFYDGREAASASYYRTVSITLNYKEA